MRTQNPCKPGKPGPKIPTSVEEPDRKSALKFLKARKAEKWTVKIYKALPDSPLSVTTVDLHEATGLDYRTLNNSLRTMEHMGLVEWREAPGKKTTQRGGKLWSICFKPAAIRDASGQIVAHRDPLFVVTEEFLAASSIFHVARRCSPNYTPTPREPWHAKGLL